MVRNSYKYAIQILYYFTYFTLLQQDTLILNGAHQLVIYKKMKLIKVFP